MWPAGLTYAGLKQLIIQFKPDYIFLQEMVGTKEHLDANLGGEYECQVNVDVQNANQPGCALAWRSMLSWRPSQWCHAGCSY